MKADMVYPQPRGPVARLRERVRATVRFWVDGPQILRPDTPQGVSMVWTHPSWVQARVMETVPGRREEPIRVGAYCGLHHTAVIIAGGQHHMNWVGLLHAYVDEDGDWVSDPDHFHSKGSVVIGNDCFVGYGAIIDSGVTIGDGAVVGAGAVVSRDVEPFSIVVGNPARHAKYRFEEPVREALLRIRWWDWDVAKVRAHRDQIISPEAEQFVAQHDPDLGPASCDLCRTDG